jgi:hypothetical protein
VRTTHQAPPPQSVSGVSGAQYYGCTSGGGSGGTAVAYYFQNNSGAVAYAVGPQGTYTLQANGGQAEVSTTTGSIWEIENASGGCLGGYSIIGSGQITVS